MLYYRKWILDFMNEVNITSISDKATHLIDLFYDRYVVSKNIRKSKGNVTRDFLRMLEEMSADGVLHKEYGMTLIEGKWVWAYQYHLPLSDAIKIARGVSLFHDGVVDEPYKLDDEILKLCAPGRMMVLQYGYNGRK